MPTRSDPKHQSRQPGSTRPQTPEADLEVQITQTGQELLVGLTGVLHSLHLRPGPQALASKLGIDLVLASRVLKAIQNDDPITTVYRSPGPEPLRRLLRASEQKGVEPELIADARDAVNNFETLIRDQIGDRSALETIVSSWVPEARREFELRRKQTVFRAMSQLKGTQARVTVATVFLNPSKTPDHLDVVWISGLLGLQRIRPGAPVKFATRRMDDEGKHRQPRDLDARPVDNLLGLRLHDYCSTPVPELNVDKVGQVVHYTLGNHTFGPQSEVDIVFAEANFAELDQYLPPNQTSSRKAYFFAEVLCPSKVLQFDLLVHKELYPDQDPDLVLYDTAFEGVANVNDRSRDIDRMDMMESVERLGIGIDRCGSSDVPRYVDILRHACDRLGWDANAFRAYRSRIHYPLYGSQAAMTFRTVSKE